MRYRYYAIVSRIFVTALSFPPQRRDVVHWAPLMDPETNEQVVLNSAICLHTFMRAHKFKKQRNQCGPASRDLNTIYYRWKCADPMHGDCPALLRSLTSKHVSPKVYTLEYATSHVHNSPVALLEHVPDETPTEEIGHVFKHFPPDLQESIDDGLRLGIKPKFIYQDITSGKNLEKLGWRQALDTEKLVSFDVVAHINILCL
jgi:hypothetical protein